MSATFPANALVAAFWGPKDVKAQLRTYRPDHQHISPGQYNSIFGDPQPGVTKSFCLVYINKFGQVDTLACTEYELCQLPYFE